MCRCAASVCVCECVLWAYPQLQSNLSIASAGRRCWMSRVTLSFPSIGTYNTRMPALACAPAHPSVIPRAHPCACMCVRASIHPSVIDPVILDRKLRARVDAEPDLFWLDIFDQLLNPNKFVGCPFDWWVDRFVTQLGVLSRNRSFLLCTVPTPIPVTVIIQEHYCGRSLTSMARTWARAI